jgi:dTMP kinase
VSSTEPRRGTFIALEGPDGAGKSTQAGRLAEALRARGHDVTLTREPGGTPVGERIREVLLARGDGHPSPVADALLFNASRAELVRLVIRPALDAGGIVICDRFADSTVAYQGHGSGLRVDALRALEHFATAGLRPDVVVLLDLSPAAGLGRRASGAASDVTRFERSAAHDAAFHGRVREGFLALAREDPERWRIVDAAGDADAVHASVLAAVEPVATSSEPNGTPVRTGG